MGVELKGGREGLLFPVDLVTLDSYLRPDRLQQEMQPTADGVHTELDRMTWLTGQGTSTGETT